MEPAVGIVVSELDAARDMGATQQASDSREDNVILPKAGNSKHPASALDRQTTTTSDSVNIYCIYSSNPSDLTPNSTRWFKDGQRLPVQSSPATTSSNTNEHLTQSLTATGYPVLTIHQVKRQDAGLYDCQVSNSVGTSERLAQSEACKLEVNFRPSVQLRVYKPTVAKTDTDYQMDELAELDLSQELVVPGNSYVLRCLVLEAQPKKIDKYHWHRTTLQTASKFGAIGSGRGQDSSSLSQQLIGVTESAQFVLSSLATNFTPSSFACSAFNSLGASDQSNQLELQLSYAPGKFHFSHLFARQ